MDHDPAAALVDPDAGLRVIWERLGEGWRGAYDPDDPDDEELLRFTVFERDDEGRWSAVRDGSYCTAFPVESPAVLRRAGLVRLLAAFSLAERHERSLRRLAETMSDLRPTDPDVLSLAAGQAATHEVSDAFRWLHRRSSPASARFLDALPPSRLGALTRDDLRPLLRSDHEATRDRALRVLGRLPHSRPPRQR